MLDQFLVVAGITLLVMVSPGPDMVIVLRNTVFGGRVGGLQTSLGVLAGNLVHITYCAVGVGWLVSQYIVAFNIIKYAGAAYLIYLGLMSFRAGNTQLDPRAAPRRPGRTWFLQGFINNVLNPKGTLFYLGVFTMVITPGTPVTTTLLLVVTMMAISAGFWLAFIYTLDRQAVRRLIERGQRLVNALFGGLLICLGIRVAVLDR